MQGWRRTMEDAHICAAKLHDRADMSLFGVFDGHGGAEVAQFCAKYFIRELIASSTFQNGDFDNALKEGFHKMDMLLSDKMYAHEVTTVRDVSLDMLLCAASTRQETVLL
jgi:protein phosphatase 1G